MTALLPYLLALVLQPVPPCFAVVIDVGGFHQLLVVGIFQGNAPGIPITQYSAADTSELAGALARATDCGARVINLSLSVSGDFPDVREAVARAVAADVLIVAASGNDGPEYPTKYPAAYPGVLAVEATEHPSNPGRIAAATATSYAAPIVAGTAARMRAINPALSAIATTFILTSTARNGVLNADEALFVASGRHRTYLQAVAT